MPTRTWCSALIACFLLVGCTVLNPRVERAAKKLDCDGSKEKCTVIVTVDCLRYFHCDISVDHDLILVAEPTKQVDIHWVLKGEPGAEFAAKGIDIDPSVFDCKPQGKDGISCRDKHPDFGVYKYSLRVTVRDSVFGPRGVPALDPWIVNH